jgi:hypothetical protein
VLAGGAEKEGERRRRAACFRFRDSVPPCYSTRLKTLAPATNKCTLPLAVRSQVSEYITRIVFLAIFRAFRYLLWSHLNAAFNGRFMGEGGTQEPNVRVNHSVAYKEFTHLPIHRQGQDHNKVSPWPSYQMV